MSQHSTENPFVILLYHGVTREPMQHGIANCSRKHLTAEVFARQMAQLEKEYTVMGLSELLKVRTNGVLPPRAVAVTFDDGFANNCTVALPILVEHKIPATFFLTSGFVDTPRIFWVDKLEYLINETELPEAILPSLDRTFSLRSLEEKEAALKTIKLLLKTTPGLTESVIKEMELSCEVSPRYDYEDYQTLTWNQIHQMRETGLCQFGAHTVDHPVLSHLPRREKERQIGASKAALESKLGTSVELFAYPEGETRHFDDETIELLKSAGFRHAVTAVPGLNTQSTGDFHLRRGMVEMTLSFKECLEPLDAACR